MVRANKTSVNFSGGEVDESVLARTDLPIFNKVASRMENFMALPQGPAQYRPGFRYVHHTRNNNPAWFIEFQFKDSDSYLIEATDGYFRFYRNEGIIFKSATLTVTGASKANPCVITTSGAHGLTTGQEVQLSGIGGMTELNAKFYTVTVLTSTTFSLADVFGNSINSTAFTTYTSGGVGNVVYEIVTPYLYADLERLNYAQQADTMYLTSQYYEPRKLTRTANDSWTLSRYTRTNGPNATAQAITGITQANPAVVTYSGADNYDNGDQVYIDSVVGMTEINNQFYLVANVNTTANTFELTDLAGANINSTGYTAYASGGLAENYNLGDYPSAVGFTDDSRLLMAGTINKPETIYFSKTPSAAGAVQFDDFTTGSGATDGLAFTLAPLQGKVDAIRWATNTDKYIALGTFASVRRIYGATEEASVAPDEITAKASNSDGADWARPTTDGATLFYISRDKQRLESLEYDIQIDGYSPDDKNLVSDKIVEGGLRQIARQTGRPTIIWVLRTDGLLLGFTYKGKENIAGWHRHKLGGAGTVETIGIMPRENNQEQLWIVSKRTIDGNTVRYVEFMEDFVDYPDIDDYYSAPTAKAADELKFLNYQSEKMKEGFFVDCGLTYDGSVYGTDAGASITLGTGADTLDTEGVIVTASASVFTSDMVGRQIWGSYNTLGTGGGRLEITNYTSGTQVEGTIKAVFETSASFAAGAWFITATSVSGLDHLEGETVYLQTDGAIPNPTTVSSGAVSFTNPSSVVHVGYHYRGVVKTLPLDQGGQSGPAQNKIKIIERVAIRMVDSGGIKFGSSLYRLQPLEFRRGNDVSDRPVPLFTGVDEQTYEDTHSEEKVLYIVNDRPEPATIAALDIFTQTTDE